MRKPDSYTNGKRTSQATREDTPPLVSRTSSSSPSPNDPAPSLRRKKKIIPDEREEDIPDGGDDDDDGDEADAEFGGIRGGTPYVGVSERRRRSAAQTIPSIKARSDDFRRHSAVA
jgi:hypothetical protein